MPFMGRHLLFNSGGALPPVPTIRQHADSVDFTSPSVIFPSGCLAGSLVLIRAWRYAATLANMNAADGMTTLAQVSASAGGNDGGLGAFYKSVAAGETTFRRGTGNHWLCAYEITGVAAGAPAYLSASGGTSFPPDLGNHVTPNGLLFLAFAVVGGNGAAEATFAGAVESAAWTETHDQPVGGASGHDQPPWVWAATAVGNGLVDRNPAATFTPYAGPPAQTLGQFAGISVLVAPSSPF